ncbi:Bromodomain-containing protein [Bisporella sp. PMI_857]|nr:Bromodomain-containing protein [Bisporella sp. PMI_857]
MAHQGVDLTADEGDVQPLSWHDPHPAFVILLVGPQEVPFGIQKDLLCAKSPYYRNEFANAEGRVEYIVKLPETDSSAFGCFQCFLFTGTIMTAGQEIPTYAVLLGVWKLATKLQMSELRIGVLDAMTERRRQTGNIPGTALLIQAWEETEDGSGLRLMLIQWAADHLRSAADQRNNFARSLPQEILSELVIAMANIPPSFSTAPVYHPPPAQHQAQATFPNHQIHMEADPRPPTKRPRKSAPNLGDADDVYEVKPSIRIKPSRKSEPVRRVPKPKAPLTRPEDWTAATEVEYCTDLIERMIRGPGYWTRLVGPFRKPVDPERDSVPNYFDVVKKPMDLSTIKSKIEEGKYASGAEFENDVRQIFRNCYEYWTQEDGIWKTCQEFERYFDTQWGERYRWTPGSKFHRGVKTEVVE